jgi:hypothetical protein
MTKLIVAFCCFAKSPKSDKHIMAEMCDVLTRYTRLENYIRWSVCAFTAYGEFKYVENVVISELLIIRHAEGSGLYVTGVTVLHLPTFTNKNHEISE